MSYHVRIDLRQQVSPPLGVAEVESVIGGKLVMTVVVTVLYHRLRSQSNHHHLSFSIMKAFQSKIMDKGNLVVDLVGSL